MNGSRPYDGIRQVCLRVSICQNRTRVSQVSNDQIPRRQIHKAQCYGRPGYCSLHGPVLEAFEEQGIFVCESTLKSCFIVHPIELGSSGEQQVQILAGMFCYHI